MDQFDITWQAYACIWYCHEELRLLGDLNWVRALCKDVQGPTFPVCTGEIVNLS